MNAIEQMFQLEANERFVEACDRSVDKYAAELATCERAMHGGGWHLKPWIRERTAERITQLEELIAWYTHLSGKYASEQ